MALISGPGSPPLRGQSILRPTVCRSWRHTQTSCCSARDEPPEVAGEGEKMQTALGEGRHAGAGEG